MKKVKVTVKRPLKLSLSPDGMAHEGPPMMPGSQGLAVQTVWNSKRSQVTLVMPLSGGLGWVAMSDLVELPKSP